MCSLSWLDLPAGRQGADKYMNYFVYILYNKIDKKFYTGTTNDLLRRLIEHNKISGSTNTTKYRSSFILVHAEECSNRNFARTKRKILEKRIW